MQVNGYGKAINPYSSYGGGASLRYPIHTRISLQGEDMKVKDREMVEEIVSNWGRCTEYSCDDCPLYELSDSGCWDDDESLKYANKWLNENICEALKGQSYTNVVINETVAVPEIYKNCEIAYKFMYGNKHSEIKAVGENWSDPLKLMHEIFNNKGEIMETKFTKFKTGDKVRVTKSKCNKAPVSIGDTGVVSYVSTIGVYGYKVVMDKDNYYWWFDDINLELVEGKEIMETKFKTGDKVRVVGSDELINDLVCIAFGDTGVVASVLKGCYAVNMDKGDYWYFCDEDLELVKEKEMTKFKIGDKVRVTKCNKAPVSIGDTGFVSDITTGSFNYVITMDADKDYWFFADHQLELVMEKEMMKFKTGDRVVLNCEYGALCKGTEVTITKDNGGLYVDIETDGGRTHCLYKSILDLISPEYVIKKYESEIRMPPWFASLRHDEAILCACVDVDGNDVEDYIEEMDVSTIPFCGEKTDYVSAVPVDCNARNKRREQLKTRLDEMEESAEEIREELEEMS